MDTLSDVAVADKFYTSFANRDIDGMLSCYDDAVTFEDPAFGKLTGSQPHNMWSMLLKQGDSGLKITHSAPVAKNDKVVTNWEAVYKFSKTGRQVHNIITATMTIKNGKIIEHKDVFDIWRWSRMALGTTGLLLGFTPLVKNKIRSQALKALHKFESQQ
ncbi:nuclear transport factor 2 family protein [Fulvivirga lutimaris]|uniref:nuclear transport factor 2 family protein n=1 Tax=Fulvivirga lutimaris TaxID=1819566 RepID=UPI0012BBA08D|nr:nuclear transport factor 2 family protein [Fulvivirga lutimaris]MTI40787.1 nuclear transport factor 2 family protein [Fulvivirga lutimaris]